MSVRLPFKQVDVFTSKPFMGNPVAVVNCMDLEDQSILTQKKLQSIACWTNLSETTFLFKPDDPQNDYKLRIFTPANELPFAGHPTVGSCKAFLEFTGRTQPGAQTTQTVRQECGVGVVTLTLSPQATKFKGERADLVEIGDAIVDGYARALGVPAATRPQLVPTGPNWVVYYVSNAETCYNAEPDFKLLAELGRTHDHTGVILAGPKGNDGNDDEQYEIRAFAPVINVDEDPVCGSGALSFIRYMHHLNGYKKTTEIKITQGGRVHRDGRIAATVQVDTNGNVTYHVGGDSVTVIDGQILL